MSVEAEQYEGKERREKWEKCGHHEGLENKVDSLKNEMRVNIGELKNEMIHMKIMSGKYDERFLTLFKKIDELTVWVKGFVMLAFGTLLTFFVWYVQRSGV